MKEKNDAGGGKIRERESQFFAVNDEGEEWGRREGLTIFIRLLFLLN